MALTKRERRNKIKKRIRKGIKGTSKRPRLSVFRSNKHIYAQIVDDVKGNTLVSASSLEKEIELNEESNNIKVAEAVGAKLGEKAKNANVDTVVFDRSGYRYHGRIKALAESARKSGLKF
jgi:large subunit ribosomal protein L18